jgi:uncharacterized membrane protein
MSHNLGYINYYLYLGVILGTLIISMGACSGWGDRFADEELWRSDQVTWSDVQTIIETECTYCHGETLKAGAPIPLETYAQNTHWIERIWVRVFLDNDMPPGGIQNAESYETFLKWIEQERNNPGSTYNDSLAGDDSAGDDSAGNTTTGNTNGGQDDEGGNEAGMINESITWEKDILMLFTIYCNNCHSDPPTGGAPFPLLDYEQAQMWLERIQIRTVEQKTMPPGGVMDPIDLQKIADWIMTGAARD